MSCTELAKLFAFFITNSSQGCVITSQGDPPKNYFFLVTREALGEHLQPQVMFYTLKRVKMKMFFAIPGRDDEKLKKGVGECFNCLWVLLISGTFKPILPVCSSGDQEASVVDKAASLTVTIHNKDLKLSRATFSGICRVIKPFCFLKVGVIDSGSCSLNKSVM